MRTHASSGESFIHPFFKESYQPTREEQMLFAEEIRRRIQSEILIKRVSFYSGKRCTVLNISESNFNEFSKRACTITEDFFKFVGALPVPQLEFIRLRPETTFEQNSRSFQFYVIGTTAEVKRAEYSLFYREVEKFGAVEISQKAGGFLENAGYMVRLTQRGYQLTEQGTRFALIPLNKDSLIAYTTAPAEALHARLYTHRMKLVEEDLNNVWEKTGRPERGSSELIEKTGHYWLEREEGIVHALLDAFVEQHTQKERFSSTTLKEYLHPFGNQREYRLIPAVRAALTTTTPTALLKEYLESPRSLYKRLNH